MLTRNRTLFVVLSFLLFLPGVATAQDAAFDPATFDIGLDPVADGFTDPVYVTSAGDDRLFVLERAGVIRIVENGTVLESPFLDISDRVGSDASEGGHVSFDLDQPEFPGRARTHERSELIVVRFPEPPLGPDRLGHGVTRAELEDAETGRRLSADSCSLHDFGRHHREGSVSSADQNCLIQVAQNLLRDRSNIGETGRDEDVGAEKTTESRAGVRRNASRVSIQNKRDLRLLAKRQRDLSEHGALSGHQSSGTSPDQ